MSPPSAIQQSLTESAIASSIAVHNRTETKIVETAAAPVNSSSTPGLPELDASKLKITITKNPRPFIDDVSGVEWGNQDVCTDHWITAKWTDKTGWEAPELKPYGPMEDLMPTASCLQYATECFEGLKAYRGYDGALRMFRPNRNAARMLMSSTRIALPSFPPSELEKLIKTLIAYDAPKWLPKPGTCIYVRPTMIGTGVALGVQKPREARLFIVAALFPILDTKPMKLLASSENSIRAWPGGFGYAKVGANYGPSLMAQKEAQSRGYDQILWLFDKSCLVTEAGASNFFVIWRNKETNKLELVTAPLDDKIILDGVTRRSLLELARARLTGTEGEIEGLEVVERKYTMHEVVMAAQEGRLLETFAAGTAYFVTSVVGIHFRGVDIQPLEKAGKYTSLLKNWLKGIVYGKERHEWGHIIDEIGFKAEPQDEAEIEALAQKIREMKSNPAWSAALARA